ncbi:type II CAAX endopeptidase family protein [Streptomyces erythrochromogenes]|uniref:CPBP family intramembrane glutamic endopeptidase n=1 Tax=Streptomyces erythrochromogenes TaxID=285574 RepID=UPI0034334EA7
MISMLSYRPTAYFAWSFAASWVFWVLAAVLSYQPSTGALYTIPLLLGLVAPCVVALVMTLRGGREMRRETWSRLVDLRRIRLQALLPMALFMPAVVIVSIGISVALGGSAEQLRHADGYSFSAGAAPVLLMLLLAAVFEELGWRTYGVPGLQQRLGEPRATLVFGALWSAWHLPLLLIHGYYLQEIAKQSPWFAVNFILGVIPLAVIISRLCRLNRGSVAVAIGFHFMVNLCQEQFFQMSQTTKCIESVVLAVIAAGILYADRRRTTPGETTAAAPVPARSGESR